MPRVIRELFMCWLLPQKGKISLLSLFLTLKENCIIWWWGENCLILDLKRIQCWNWCALEKSSYNFVTVLKHQYVMTLLSSWLKMGTLLFSHNTKKIPPEHIHSGRTTMLGCCNKNKQESYDTLWNKRCIVQYKSCSLLRLLNWIELN